MGNARPDRLIPGTREATSSNTGAAVPAPVIAIPRCARFANPAAARHTGAVTDRTAGDEAHWRAALSPERYAVMRQAATEPPFTGKYNDCDTPGRYRCGACGAELFDSSAKFHSGTGWPSFTAPVAEAALTLEPDRTYGIGAHRGQMPPLRVAPRARLRRRPRPHREALLHEQHRARPRSRDPGGPVMIGARSIEERVVVVTGASGGIGRATAVRLAERGARVVACARDTSRLRRLAIEVPGIEVRRCDVRSPAERAAFIDGVLARHGRVDALVNNAGVGWEGLVEDMDYADVERLVTTNVTALIDLTRLVLPSMLEARSGDIVLVSSVSGLRQPAAADGLLRHQVRRRGVRRRPAPRGVAARGAGAHDQPRSGPNGMARPVPRLGTSRRLAGGEPVCGRAGRLGGSRRGALAVEAVAPQRGRSPHSGSGPGC